MIDIDTLLTVANGNQNSIVLADHTPHERHINMYCTYTVYRLPLHIYIAQLVSEHRAPSKSGEMA